MPLLLNPRYFAQLTCVEDGQHMHACGPARPRRPSQQASPPTFRKPRSSPAVTRNGTLLKQSAHVRGSGVAGAALSAFRNGVCPK